MISARTPVARTAKAGQPRIDLLRSSRKSDRVVAGLVATGLAVTLLYVLVYPLRGIHWAAGWDTSFYVWWTRRAQAFGLAAAGTGSRPGTVGLLAALSSALRVSVPGVASALGPTLAAACGLGFAAFVEISMPVARRRALLTTLLVGGFLSWMVLGYLATLVFLASLACALTCIAAVGSGQRAGRAGIAASVLLGASALAHPTLIPLALLLVGAAAVAPLARRGQVFGGSKGLSRTTMGRTALVIAGGAVLFVAGFAIARAAPGPVLDRARDGAMRRLALPGLVTQSYRDAFMAYLPFFVPTVLASIFAVTVIWPRRRSLARTTTATRVFWCVAVTWVVTTLAAVALLLFGFRAPGQRLAPVCLALPGLVSIALALLSRDPTWTRASRWIVAVPVVAAVVVPNLVLWASYAPGQPPVVEAAEALGPLLAREPAGTQLVVIADLREERVAIAAIGYANAVRAVLPPGRVADVNVFLGAPGDFLAGRPTATGSTEHDRLARDYWRQMKPKLRAGSLAVVVRAFDQRSYAKTSRLPGSRILAPGVIGLPGYHSVGPVLASAAGRVRAGAGRFSPWLPVLLGPMLLVLLGLVGWPWAAWILGDQGRLVVLGVAPGIGLAAVALAAIFIDAAHRPMGHLGSIAAIVLPGAIGVAVMVFGHRRSAVPRLD